jgi:hypothetical protein
MLALALSVGIFVFASIVGLGLTSALRRSPLALFEVLLAPPTGFAVIMVLLVPISRAGVPIDTVALPFVALLLASAISILVIRRPVRGVTLRNCIPFAAILAVALLLIGSPMLSFGFNWFAYANPDAVNYALSAERLREKGVDAKPNLQAYLSDKDVRENYYFLNGAVPDRYGSDEILALVSAAVRTDALRLVMPLLLALQLAALTAVAALVLRGERGFEKALAASTLLAISALATFGLDEQLLAQVAALMLSSAALASICAPGVLEVQGRERVASWGLPMVLTAALFEAYPELTPFVGFAAGMYYLRFPRIQFARVAVYLGILLFGVGVLLNEYIANVVWVFAERMRSANVASVDKLFPYYLVPSGLYNVFGIAPVATFPTEPWISLAILLGMVAAAVVLFATLRRAWRGEPAALLLLPYILIAILFFARHNGFALYKLAMYLQPSLAAVLAGVLVDGMAATSIRRRIVVATFGAALVATNLLTQQRYVMLSRADVSLPTPNFADVPGISETALFDRLDEMRRALPNDASVVSDADNKVLAEIETFYSRGRGSIAFPVEDFQVPFYDLSRNKFAQSVVRQRKKRFSGEAFSVNGSLRSYFLVDRQDRASASTLWLHGGLESIFNRTTLPNEPVESLSGRSVRNVVAFVDSSLGEPYYNWNGAESLFQLQHDPFFPQDSMCGIGRYLLFQVLNPTRVIRVRITFTQTLISGDRAAFSPVSIIGASRVDLPLTGGGSASIVSGDVVPRIIDGRAYILLDMGRPPTRFSVPRTGLMWLWGTKVDLDPRRLTAFLRDLSFVDTRYRPAAPSGITKFPDDLRSPRVTYSGLYEDGWASGDVSVTLDAGASGIVHLRGFVPDVGKQHFEANVTSFVDGFPIEKKRLSVGDVDIPVMSGGGVHSFRWRFSGTQQLPGVDGRSVSLFVKSIGDSTSSAPYSANRRAQARVR